MKKTRLELYKFTESKTEAVRVCRNKTKKKKKKGRSHSLHGQPKAIDEGG